MTRLFSVLALLVMLAVPVTAAADLPPAQEVLDAFVEAIGGRDAVMAQEHRVLSGSFSVPSQGVQGPIRVTASAPDRLRLDISIEGFGEVATGYDGKVGWSVDPLSGPLLLLDDALDDIREQAEFYEVLKEDGLYETVETVAIEDIDGTSCWKIRLARASGRESFEFYDRKTGLLFASDATQATPMGTIEARTRILEYADFGGVLYPSKMSQSLMGIEQVFVFTEADFGKLDPSVFALPEEIQVLVEENEPVGAPD